jgi:beta-xylosidase
MKTMRIACILSLVVVLAATALKAQQYQQAGNGNPIIPGYFADPTVKKFGDTYYIYATTDGNGGGFGPSQAWTSKDFVNWTLQDMNWPTTHHYWAPDVTQGSDGNYYLYYCQPVEIFGAKAKTPLGPWTSLLPEGKPIVPNFLVPNVITLDGQTFKDDDGKQYMFWGTWGIYPNHGCGVGLLNPDMKSFEKLAQIPNTIAKEFFEAPFMFKRKGIYYLTYSSGYCEDGTYRVQYVMSKTGPMGPFVFGKNNPILATNADETVHGPGHQSVLQQGEECYLIYHRHNNPHAGGGYHRQVAADRMEFDEEGNIKALVPTHKGIGFLAKNENPHANLALGAKATASSTYSKDFDAQFAVDDNNGTLWKAKNNIGSAWLLLDLGAAKMVRSIHTQFEYATWYYQYQIEASADGKSWNMYADRSKNVLHGSPMIDLGNVKARYLRLRILQTEYPGLNKAVWNIKVFDDDSYQPQMAIVPRKVTALNQYDSRGLLVQLDADKFPIGKSLNSLENGGLLKGNFSTQNNEGLVTAMIAGRKAFVFLGTQLMKSSFKAPLSLKGNSSHTVAVWVYNEALSPEETIVTWTRGGESLAATAMGYGSNPKRGAVAHQGWADMGYQNVPEAGKWHHIALVFDGTMEKLYVDGKLDKAERKMLFIDRLSNMVLGGREGENAGFSGAIANLQLYDLPLTAATIAKMANAKNTNSMVVYLQAATMADGVVKEWQNDGRALGKLKADHGQLTIAPVANRMAASLSNQAELSFDAVASTSISFAQPFSLAMPYYGAIGDQTTVMVGKGWDVLTLVGEGKWVYWQINFDGKTLRAYKNDKLQQTLRAIPNNPQKFKIKSVGNNNAFGGIYLYQKAFKDGELVADYQAWKATFATANVNARFAQQPAALSPSMVSMAAAPIKLVGNQMQYQFSELNKLRKSGWLNSTDFLDLQLPANTNFGYTVQARDQFGNVSGQSATITTSTAMDHFNVMQVGNGNQDYLTAGGQLQFWDGRVGSADELMLKDNVIKLASTKTFWDGATNVGPMLYKQIVGDFVAEVEVVDLSGLKERKPNGANDAGLMAWADEDKYNLIQNSVMLGWGVGNLITNLSNGERRQTNNASAWNFYRHLQLQRKGNTFYLRGSTDGSHWVDLPNGMIVRDDLKGKPLKVGIYQATYGDTSGYASFSGFKIVQQR